MTDPCAVDSLMRLTRLHVNIETPQDICIKSSMLARPLRCFGCKLGMTQVWDADGHLVPLINVQAALSSTLESRFKKFRRVSIYPLFASAWFPCEIDSQVSSLCRGFREGFVASAVTSPGPHAEQDFATGQEPSTPPEARPVSSTLLAPPRASGFAVAKQHGCR